jgi:hypothetical protein
VGRYVTAPCPRPVTEAALPEVCAGRAALTGKKTPSLAEQGFRGPALPFVSPAPLASLASIAPVTPLRRTERPSFHHLASCEGTLLDAVVWRRGKGALVRTLVAT